ncbi:glycoside hydrolase family 73 protein [Paraburkholderia sediminicola]|uniref:glycoside hydrolase family 73 protein n=1 Tax=Paraburkholderia sediminicola TaxID=458836 RepID=UPI0038B94B5E
MANDAQTQFTEQYSPAAIKAGAALGVAPSVILGQWGVETGWGKSVIPGTNNLGNIKDFSGGGVLAKDNATGTTDRYRSFSSPDEFADHFVDLIKRKYPDAVNAPDAAAFSNGLKKGGYAQDPAYVSKVVGAQMSVPKGIVEKTMDAMIGSASAAEPGQTQRVDNPFANGSQSGAQQPDYSKMSDDQLMSIAQGNQPPAQQPAQPDYSKLSDDQLRQLAGPQAAPDTTSFLGRIGHGAMNVIQGGAQTLAHIVPDSVANAVNEGAQWLNEHAPITKTLGITPATPQQIDQQTAQREADYQRSRGSNAGTTDIGAGIGELAATAPLMFAGPVGATGGRLLPGLARAAATGAAYGAGGAAFTPVTDPNASFEDAKLGQMATGAIGGAVAGPVAEALGRGVSRIVSPNVRPEVQSLLDQGVTPTPGQIIGPTAAKLEQRMESLPFVGGGITQARTRAVEDLNVAALNRPLKAIGEAPLTSADFAQDGIRGSIGKVEDAISDKYDALLPKLRLDITPALGTKLNAIEQTASQSLPQPQADFFSRIIQNTFGTNLNGGALAGRDFKTMESALTAQIRSASIHPDPYVRDMAGYLKQFQQALREGLAASNPAHAQELSALNRAWANFTVLQRAAARVTDENAPMTVAGLQAAVKANNSTVRKGGFARGNALMQDLTDPAVAVLGNKVPDSGTAGRGLLGAALLGHGLSPHTLALGGAARLLYTKPGQAAMAALLTQRPQFAAPVAGLVRQGSAPIGGLLSGQAGADLSNRPQGG